MIKIICAYLGVVFLTLCSAAKYPSELSRCKFGDVNCLRQEIQTTFAKFVDGYPSLNMPSLDPLAINEISIKQGAESPVNIELVFKKAKLLGLKDIEFTKVTGFSKDPNGHHAVHFKLPFIKLLGDYSINGRVLILPIQGEGPCNLTVMNPVGSIKFKGNSITKSGKEYMQISNFKYHFDTTRLYIDFQNLFKGDKALGDNTNLFLNENWQDIFNELKVNIYDAFGQVMESIVNVVFSRIPYNELFLE